MQNFFKSCLSAIQLRRSKPGSGRQFPLLSCAFAAVVASGLSMPNSAEAAGIIVNAPAPNWALGNPQFPRIGACSDGKIGAANFTCFGASDVLAFQNQFGGPVVFGWLTENGEKLANPIYWIDIRIPNAVWLSQAAGIWRDGDEAAGVASDYIGFINSPFIANGQFGLANLLLISNNSDNSDPFPATSFFDIFVDLNLDAAAYNFLRNGPETDLTGSINLSGGCTNTTTTDLTGSGGSDSGSGSLGSVGSNDCGGLDLSQFAPKTAQVPEPSTLSLFGIALVAVGSIGFLRKRGRALSDNEISC